MNTQTIEAQIQDCIDRNERGIERLQNIQSLPSPRRSPWPSLALAFVLGAVVGAVVAIALGVG
jgi:hypothetical protein